MPFPLAFMQGPTSDTRTDLTLCFESTILLGLPSILAILVFARRGHTLFFTNDSSHVTSSVGSRTRQHRVIYRLSATGMLTACAALIARVVQVSQGSISAPATLLGTVLLLVSWLAAAVLNYMENKWDVRSSTYIYAYYVVTLIASAIHIRTMYDLALTEQTQFISFCVFFSAIVLGFVVEAWPRNATVQNKNTPDEDRPTAYDRSNLMSRLCFHFIQSVISTGHKRPLVDEDVANIMPRRIRTVHSYDLVSREWEKLVARCNQKTHQQEQQQRAGNNNISNINNSKQTPSLIWAILKAGGWSWLPLILLALVESITEYTQPVLLDLILDFIASFSTNDPNPTSYGIILSISMFLVALLCTLASGQFFQMGTNLGLEFKTGLVSMIYRKSLKLSPAARRETTVGEISNHMSVDAERIGHAIQYLPRIITVPCEICVGLWLLYRQLGPSAFTGLAVVLLSVPVQALIAKKLTRDKDRKLKAMDSRVRLMNEVMSSIKIVKLYAWERPFRAKLNVHRKTELKHLRQIGTTVAFMMIMFTSLPALMTLLSFAVYSLVGGPGGARGVMSAQIVFVSVTLFNRLARPIGTVSSVISQSISFVVAVKRIQLFLLQEELDDTQIEYSNYLGSKPSADCTANDANGSTQEKLASNVEPGSEPFAIAIQDGIFSWYQVEATIRSKAKTKETSSKTADNISESERGSTPTSERPSTGPVLTDINLVIPWGSLSIVMGRVGQGKSSLLSAIIGDMYKYQGRAQVRGRIAYVPQQAWIINASLKDNILFGRELNQDRYESIVAAAGLAQDFTTLPAGDLTEIGERGINLSGGQKQRVSLARAAYQDADVYLLDDPLSAVDAHVDQHLWLNLIGPNGLLKDKTRLLVTHGIHHLSEADQIIVIKNGKIDEIGQYSGLMKDQGSFFKLVSEYSIKEKQDHAGGMAPEADSPLTTNVEFKRDIVEKDVGPSSHTGVDIVKEDGIAQLILEEEAAAGSVGWTEFKAYCKAGFSSDVDNVDELVPYFLSDFYFFLTTVMGTLLVISISVPIFLAVIPVLVVLYLIIQTYYIRSARALKRIYSISKSPLYQHFDETLSGTSTIRALRVTEQFISDSASKSDGSSNSYFAYMISTRWMQVRLEFLGAIVVLATSLLAVLGRETLGAAMAGLALSYSLQATFSITLLVISFSELQNQLVSVERIREYSEKNTEAPDVTGTALPLCWPAEGRITFNNYSTRYRHGMDLAIKDVSFSVDAGEKIGIVGRTGAGKSSLTLALFRIIEAANSHWAMASHNGADTDADTRAGADTGKAPMDLEKVAIEVDGGSIEIDGVDISTIGLETLRQHLSIIPQDPTLFAGTVRDNLDPFNHAQDSELWEALERAHLKEYISSMPGGLSHEVAQNGENFSVGQRSLICLARALLRKTRILVLDEATAAVDVETDDLIQKTIRQEFKDRTILTIAHRIRTVMDSDKILVLEKGQVKEFDAPEVLLARKGLFHSLAEQAGEIVQ
ncbi:Canalicular multispecific organic anion transporter 2 [Podila humilis]|nr:Canalicular multispecific organic anion transporter 2 [Podila humilis]